jgi:hypothetical protein
LYNGQNPRTKVNINLISMVSKSANTSSATPRSELMAAKEDAIVENAEITLYDMLTHLAERMQ